MNKLERQNQICDYVSRRGTVSVKDLCAIFPTSEATIRRDLENLDILNRVKRTHGGASAIAVAEKQQAIYKRQLINAQEKDSIARVAANLIDDGDTIFLGTGSSVLGIAKYLKGKHDLTVISNSLPVINELIETDIDVIIIGGLLRKSELSCIGHIAEISLKELRADKVIMGADAIHVKQGLTNGYVDERITDRTILDIASEIIIVADTTKFEKTKSFFLLSLSKIDVIVTDWRIPADIVSQFENESVKIIVAEEP